MSEKIDSIAKKRKRIYGDFICDIDNCNRKFNRADHLLRHKRNHDPSKRFSCMWPDCSMIFARKDIKDKHYKRHSSRKRSLEYKDTENSTASGVFEESLLTSQRKKPKSNETLNPSYSNDCSTLLTADDSTLLPSMLDPDQVQRILGGDPSNFLLDVGSVNSIPENDEVANKTLSPSNLVEWLFQENDILPAVLKTMNGYQYHDVDFSAESGPYRLDLFDDFSPLSNYDNMLAILPNFPNSNNRKLIDNIVFNKLTNLIPSLKNNMDFKLPQIEKFLKIYWSIYHPQYPILHRPSFSNYDAAPILLLAMIMLGASLSSCTGTNENKIFKDPQKLAEEIAEPLRWLIFSDPDCKPPAKIWIVQSLLLLESYEITSTTRALHERAYLHHGSKIQLLRRSPILGGDPLKDETEDGTFIPLNNVWKKWIEAESMKRATLMAFYLDTVNATVYGHMVILYAHQIKISLPCEDKLWEFDNTKETSDSFTISKSPKFLDALKKLLHKEKVETSGFGKKILLAGLLTIMFQMQQKDLQLSFIEWNAMKESWKQTISLAVDVWKIDICSEGGCCDTQTALYIPEEEIHELPPMLRLEDKRCKFDLYHIAQIYMRITHYDYIVYAGAPSRMNVKVGSTEYQVVEKRVSKWSNSANGRISVIHAYLFLCEMLLSWNNEDITFTYDPNSDPFLHRKNIVASAVLIIFAYNFLIEGPESDVFDQLPANSDYFPDKEDGYDYLRRIRKDLSMHVSGEFHRTNYGNSSTLYHESIKLYSERILKTEKKNQLVGLLKIFHKSYKMCKWEIGKEYSNLFANCIERCLGRKKVSCDEMYIT